MYSVKQLFIFQKTSFFPVFAQAPGDRLDLKKYGNGIRAPFGQIGVIQEAVLFDGLASSAALVDGLMFERLR